MDYKKIERAAVEAIRQTRAVTGKEDISQYIAKAIAAALQEYDKQKSE